MTRRRKSFLGLAVLLLAGQVVWGFGIAAAAEPTGTWRRVAKLLAARTQHTSTPLANGRVLVTGGVADGFAILSSSEIFDPSASKWSQAPPLAEARYFHTATVLPDGRVLVTGGLAPDAEGTGHSTRSAEIFDPQGAGGTGAWSRAADMAAARSHHAASVLPDGRVLVAGGENDSSQNQESLRSAEIYQPADDTWSLAADLNVGRTDHTATPLAGGQVLVVGGYKGVPFDSSGDPLAPPELFTPDGAGGSWAPTADPGNGSLHRLGQSATRLPSGSVLVAGGKLNTGSSGPDGSSLLYDPASGTWATAAGLQGNPRLSHAATLLSSGKVLVVGGVSKKGKVLATAEVFDPAAGSWAPAGKLSEARNGLRSTLLDGPGCGRACGKVVVTGGGNDALFGLDAVGPGSSQVYTPAPQIVSITPERGPAKRRVVIAGTGLASLLRVRIGPVTLTCGAEGTARCWSDSQSPEGAVHLIAPRHDPGQVGVRVFTDGGKSLSLNFTYEGPPPPPTKPPKAAPPTAEPAAPQSPSAKAPPPAPPSGGPAGDLAPVAAPTQAPTQPAPAVPVPAPVTPAAPAVPVPAPVTPAAPVVPSGPPAPAGPVGAGSFSVPLVPTPAVPAGPVPVNTSGVPASSHGASNAGPTPGASGDDSPAAEPGTRYAMVGAERDPVLPAAMVPMAGFVVVAALVVRTCGRRMRPGAAGAAGSARSRRRPAYQRA